MTSAVATRPGPQSKCQCHTAKIAYRRGERVRGGQGKAARDTKFENQIFAINKRASRESRQVPGRGKAQSLAQSRSQSQLPFPLPPLRCNCSCHWATRSTTRRFNNILPWFVFFFTSFSCWALQHLPLDILFRPKLLPPLAARRAATDATIHTQTLTNDIYMFVFMCMWRVAGDNMKIYLPQRVESQNMRAAAAAAAAEAVAAVRFMCMCWRW